jgi:Ca-activated chloride channel homolog
MTSRRRLTVACALLAVLATARQSRSQGIIIDRHIRMPIVPIARSYEVREVALDARVRNQIAEVQVSQTFHNPGSFQIDAEYLFPLPEDGAVQNFVLLVDGKELPGRLLPKEEARRIYEEIVRTRRDPALLEYMGRGLYRTSVFPIPPGADRKVTMRYSQVCKRDRDVVEFSYPFSTQKFTAKPIQKLSLSLRIESRDAIKSLYSPTYDASITRYGDHEARISFEQRDTIPTADFRLICTLAEGSLGASVLSYRPSASDDGYFLLLASPDVKAADVKAQPKTVIFVLDRSGSMAGKKIEQARNALKFVLRNLRDDDTFNIVAYDDRVETFRPELQRYSTARSEEPIRFVENIREGGSTNIDGALKAALAMIPDDSRPSYVLFLTDGLPTAGEVKETAIADNCRTSNRNRARLFAFGVGYDVNARLLDRLSGGNSGTSEYVKPDDDIESHVARFYGKMTSPVLSDIRVELAGTDTNRTYPRDVPDLFQGGQLILAGRYRQSGSTTVRLSGKVGGERRSFEFPADLASTDRGGSYDFVEKLWATRRVGDLIDQIDLHGQNKELVDELVSLSGKYGILTPYTSFLADERVPLHAMAPNAARARSELNQLGTVTGQSGVAQRGIKRDYKLAEREAVSASSDVGYRYDAAGATPELARRLGGASAGQAVGKPGMARGMGMMGGMAGGMAGPGSAGRFGVALKDADGKQTFVNTVRRVGSKTFYRKGDHWVDATLKPEDEAKAKVVRQFSDEFFELARTQKSELNQYLTFEEPVTVDLDGKVYRFEQAPAPATR